MAKASPVSGAWGSSAFTTDFRHEFEAERERWLRRRFLWYTAAVSIIKILGISAAVVALLLTTKEMPSSERSVLYIVIGLGFASTAPYVAAFIYSRRRLLRRDPLVKLTSALIVVNGLLQLAAPLAIRWSGINVPGTNVPIGASWISNLLVAHVLACLFLPLTPKESFKPLVPLLAVNAVFALFAGGDSWPVRILAIVLSPLVGAPGAAICWWRTGRFRDRFTLQVLRGRYAELRQELLSARMIHESLFPKPVSEGPIRFNYVYEPMRQIGGDYLYAAFTPSGSGDKVLNVVLLDVTGHGIPAALTVNRLHGELDRLFAENPLIGPGEVLFLLNRYVHLTLATHSVYVTALCLRIDAAHDTLEYASGGHPPAYLRAVDGSIEQLDSTALVLGAAAGDDFESAPKSVRFAPGDTLIAYTDGATEARDSQGRYLGLAGMQRLVASGSGVGISQWPSRIAEAVDHHRHGPIADDTLVIEISRPLQVETFTVRGPRTAAVQVS